ncbi:hypothetical protein TMatcc_006611 [Talaromyces marneffei ATCC 18224]|uniref:Multi-copper oxidase, putative n=1 Tax=Talaromyces marneffei (strain ATCC 18224 / CBS 334.59 / QM 7333) TaxID=441960 RepID=B6Q9X5_TALMQ|nr:uncharacterized protein EYB26_002455 [Talaromyces marneffei]EEA25167.1 multi-copper oxidase, putative [Talaromyces marneffei ATCC 18224]QGA14799.1 hypothetical protein EYB26_002455 [Talaromyces marneffei]
MAIPLHRFLHTLLAMLPLIMALRQVRHDSNFKPDYVLRITAENITTACRTRLSAVVNRTLPGPTLYLKENQTTWIRVYNDLPSDNSTLHWHGLSQSVAPWADGTPQASQWPIKAQHFFDYELRPQIGEAGTYFYHSHVGFQAVSASGPLIVEEAERLVPYEYDEERMLFLSELFNNTDKTIQEGLTAPLTGFLWPGESESILVNGNGLPALLGNETDANMPPDNADLSGGNTTCHPEIIEVEANKTYRFRAIGGVALSPLVLAFEDHGNLTVIAADSSYTQPAETDIIQMAAGQRYDFLLHTKTEEELQALAKNKFWIQIETRYREQNDTFYAVLSYTQNNASAKALSPPAQSPVSIPYDLQDWLEYTLEPLTPNDFPSSDQVTRRVVMTAARLNAASGQFWTINNHTWTDTNQHEGDTPFNSTTPTDDTPYLVNVYKQGERALPNYENSIKNNGWDAELNVFAAEMGEVVDIILVNEPVGVVGGYDAHPFHFHGAHVWDMGSGPGVYNATVNEERLKSYNPIVRDTSLLFRYGSSYLGDGHNYTSQGWRAWRLKVTDPGVWMVHCHILQHMILGMQAVWIMGNATEITHGAFPELVAGYLTYGGDAYGNATYAPFVTHYYED